jgi:outer membrane protein assembly factor BamD (BamD/ComL family)
VLLPGSLYPATWFTASVPSTSRWERRRCGCLVIALLTLLVSGCVSPWERKALMGGRETKIDNVQGPVERALSRMAWNRRMEDPYSSESRSLKELPGTPEYLAAQELYDAEKYPEAEAAFKKVAKKFKKSDIREDALFMQAEAAYQRQHYADAQDLYGVLLKEYPSTRHLDDVSKRLFETARRWLDFPETADLGDVQQVNYDDFGRKLPAELPTEKPSSQPVFVPNFFDEEKPLFDTPGNAISALRLIWLNDPTGPLADDALMMVASYYARKGDFVEADRHYTLLREEYPNSPHVQTAFVLGSHVKLMSYQGSAYDGKTLEDAEHLKESTLRLYPELDDRERLETELGRIEEATAARVWALVEFYSRKRNKRAQAVYCHLLVSKYSHTSFGTKARAHLEQLGPEYATGAVLRTAEPDPPRPWWSVAGPQATVNPPAAGRSARTAAAPSAEADQDETAAPRSAPRRLGDLFRRNRTEGEAAPGDDENSTDSPDASDTEESIDPEAVPLDPATGQPAPRRGFFRRTAPPPDSEQPSSPGSPNESDDQPPAEPPLDLAGEQAPPGSGDTTRRSVWSRFSRPKADASTEATENDLDDSAEMTDDPAAAGKNRL